MLKEIISEIQWAHESDNLSHLNEDDVFFFTKMK